MRSYGCTIGWIGLVEQTVKLELDFLVAKSIPIAVRPDGNRCQVNVLRLICLLQNE